MLPLGLREVRNMTLRLLVDRERFDIGMILGRSYPERRSL